MPGERKSSESKEDDWEEIDNHEDWTIVNKTISYMSTSSWDADINEFFREHAHKFESAAECKHEEDVEHKLEFTDIHKDYLALFESKLEGFIVKSGSTIQEFYEELNAIEDDQYTALFDEHENKWFVEQMLSSISYEHFFKMMMNAARRSRAK